LVNGLLVNSQKQGILELDEKHHPNILVIFIVTNYTNELQLANVILQ
jgi:hypothetical protein